MFFDTHAHYDDEKFDLDRDELLEKMADAGVDLIVDEADPVPDSYIFEVSSAGCERALKRPSDFERFLGSNVEVKLYSAADGAKQWVGKLLAYEAGDVIIDAGGERRFTSKQIASVRLRMEI